MRVRTLLLAAALAATACGKYGPPVRTTEPKPVHAAPAQPTQDPNAPAPAPAPGATP
jgi:hypothetical protein